MHVNIVHNSVFVINKCISQNGVYSFFGIQSSINQSRSKLHHVRSYV